MLESVHVKFPRQVESLDDTGFIFPPSPVEGQFFWHEVDDALYRYSSQALAWICIS